MNDQTNAVAATTQPNMNPKARIARLLAAKSKASGAPPKAIAGAFKKSLNLTPNQ